MITGRNILTTALKAELERWTVVSDPRQIDTVTRPGAIVLWTGKRKRSELNGFEIIADELVLWVLTATTKPDAIEDDLDSQLHAVLEVIEGLDGFTWTEAERAVLADKFEGWSLTVQCNYKIDKTKD